jgi:basic membrane protein A
MKQHLPRFLIIILMLALSACGSVAPIPEQSAVAAVQTTPEPTDEVEVTPTSETTSEDSLVPQADTASQTAAEAPAPEKQFGLVAARIDDRGFEQLAWEGMQQAGSEVNAHTQALPGADPATASRRITQFLNNGFDGIVTVGLEMAQATKAAAIANPTVPFAIVDFPSQAANMKGLLFDVDAPSFMAGYLAAGMSQTGMVCTYGGVSIPPVLIFMVGFEHGVDYYNQQKEASVKVLGWRTDPTIDIGGEGIFAGDFGNPAFGQTIAEELAAQECDVIFPVAGATGLGSAEVAQANTLTVIGVDADQAVSNPDYADVYLTSVVKRTDLAVATTIRNIANGSFGGGSNYIGTLADGGVDLAPFHNFESAVPQELKDDLIQIRQDLIDNKLATSWPVGASKIQTSLTAGSLTLAALRNATYQVDSTADGTASLTNGKYLDPDAGLTITLGDLVAYVDFTGDGQDEAVVFLVTNFGGSDDTYDLIVMADQNGTPTQLASAPLGDQVQSHSISVKEGLIVVSLAEAGLEAEEMIKVFGLGGEQLRELSSQTVGAVVADESGAASDETAPVATTGGVSLDALKNLTYQVEYSVNITAQLSNGEYREPAASGSPGEVVVKLSDLSVTGDLDGDGVTDAAAILVSQTGTNDPVYNVVAVLDQNGTPAPVAGTVLGNRIEIKSAAIRSGIITINMLAHGPADPECCPGQEMTKNFRLQGNQLIELSP